MPDRPTRIYRVEYSAALGFPEPERRRNTWRHCFSAESAGAQLAIIASMPGHLTLHGVYVAEGLAWEPVDPASLPVPDIEPDDDVLD